MTPEQRTITYLEAELARERAEKERLLAMLESFTSKKRTAGAERQARYRETKKAASVTSDVTVTRNSDVSPAPAPSSSPPPSFSLSPPSEPSPSILYPFSPASPPPPPAASQAPAVAAPGTDGDELPDATEDAQEVRPALVLEAQQPEKPGRRQSAGEALYARLEARRQEVCSIDGVPFVESRWAHGRQNRELGPLAKAEKADAEGETWKRFVGAWLAFMEDDEAAKLDVPYSLDYFWRMRSRYEGRALKGAA